MTTMNRWECMVTLSALLAFGGVAVAQQPERVPPSKQEEAARPAPDARAAARNYELDANKQPKKAAAKVQAAKAYEAVGDVNASRTAASEALEREGNNIEAMQLLARLAAREQKWGEAVAHLRRAAQLDPNNASTQLALGQALEKTGDQAGSDAAYAAFKSLQGMKTNGNAPATR